MENTQSASGARPAPEPWLADMGSGSVLVVLGNEGEDRPGFMLGDSRLSLGAGTDDDVYLTGVGVVPGHLRLIFLEGRMTLLWAAETVRVDGQPVEVYPLDLKPLQVFSLGPDTHLTFGTAGSSWPAAPVWEVPDESPDPEAATAEQGSASPEGGYQTGAAPMSRRAQVVHGARWAALALAAATVMVVGLVVTDLAWGVRESVVPGEVAIDRSEDLLQKWLASESASYRSVLLTVREDGTLSLTGFLDSEDAYKKLAQQVRQQSVSSGGNVRMDVLTGPRLEAMVRDILARFPLIARLEISSDRILVIVSGVKLHQDLMDRIESDLARLGARTLPRKLHVEFQVQEGYKLMQQVSAALNQSPTTRDLRFEIDETGGRIAGLVPAAIEVEALAAAHAVKKAFESQLPIAIELKVDAKLNFNLVSLTQGGDAPTAILVQRGKVQTFRVGEPVFGLGELMDIRIDGVILALGRREVFIPLSR
jgi:hypothetical protein